MVDNSGRCVPILTSEGGVGRSLEPLTWIENIFKKGVGGSQQTTYTAVPHYVTSSMRSFMLENTDFAVFNLARANKQEIEIELVTPNLVLTSTLNGRIIRGATPSEIVSAYTTFSGRQRALPDWITTGGAVVGLQGGTDIVNGKLKFLLDNHVPVAAIWLQDWTGKRVTSVGSRLWVRNCIIRCVFFI